MLFSSIPFLYYFLPIVLLLYFLVPRAGKNAVLLAASLFFYFWGEPVYTLLLIGVAFCGWIFGLLIDRFRGKRGAKLFLILSVAITLSALAFFKYADFALSNFNGLVGTSIPLLKLALPIGISFYSFQTISYSVDVYRGRAKVQRNFFTLATYVALFPQLIAGPIVRYVDVEKELQERTHSFADASYGAMRFLIGLGKKVILANVLGELITSFRACADKSVLLYWIYALAFTLQIYFDFSGYSDMAIGLGRIFGFHFPENFNYPYISASVSEFWRRWHMTLSSFFRDYVYIPLGGNRVKLPRWILNILIVWMLTGLWHGADWNFVLWGLYFAVLLVAEKLFLNKLLDRIPSFFRHVYVLLAIVLSFVLFNANGLVQAGSDFAGLFGGGGLPLCNSVTLYYLRSFAPILLLAAIGSTPLVRFVYRRIDQTIGGAKAMSILYPIGLILILIAVTAYLVNGSFNPFLYFRF